MEGANEPAKFYYFPLYVRGDPILALMAHAGVQCENVAVTFEEWPTLKPNMPNN